MHQNTKETKKSKSVGEQFMYQYFPYWPLFVILLLLASAGAYTYLKYAQPVYEITANILIKDEKKGADDSKILEALNIYSSTKIVENEIEVIQSKELLKEVVYGLHLYAPIYESGHLENKSAYATSPISVEAQNPEEVKDTEEIYFKFSKKKQTVKIDNKSYPLNTWVTTPVGVLRFVPNPYKSRNATGRLFFTLESPQQVVSELSDKLVVTPASKLSTVINLAFTDVVPARGENIVNLLIDRYNKAAINDKNQLAANTLQFVEARIGFVVKELDSIETKLQNFKTKSGVVDLSEQGKLYLQSVGDNDRKMTELNMQIAMLDEVQKYVVSKDNEIGIVPSIAGVKDPLLAQLLQRLFDAQIQYERLKKTVPGGNPAMFTLKTEIENLRPTILENIKNQRNGLLAGKSNLGDGTGMYASMLRSIPKKERDLLDISRQQAIKNEAYSFLLQKREETALSYAAVVADSRTINHANTLFDPIAPRKSFVYLVAIAIALGIGFVYVMIKEMLSHKVQFRADIENLTSIPVVAEVIKVRGKSSEIVNNNTKQLGFIEQFRQLRASIALNGRHLKHRKILVTSSIEGEGKSFIGNNLALSLALSGKRTLMIDLDLRHPRTTAHYQLSGEPGIADYLEKSKQSLSALVFPTSNEKLFIMPAGYSTVNPTELLLNAEFTKVLAELEEQFDFIIIDTCPIDPVTDAFILSEYCDATLFVIRHNYTPKSMVEMLEETKQVSALKNISIVFNGIDSRGFFSKRYGYGYGYGRKKVYGDHVYKSEAVASRK